MNSAGTCGGRSGWDSGLRWGGYCVRGKDVAPIGAGAEEARRMHMWESVWDREFEFPFGWFAL